MIKYELRECIKEVNYKERNEIAPGCTANQDDLVANSEDKEYYLNI